MPKILHSSRNTVVVDVRNVEEFSGEHLDNSVNIPLDIIGASVNELKKYDSITVVCASGVRSAQAKEILDSAGLKNVSDGGSWQNYFR
jgi:rhodanese-related sulfurtransferase